MIEASTVWYIAEQDAAYTFAGFPQWLSPCYLIPAHTKGPLYREYISLKEIGKISLHIIVVKSKWITI
jgi:hypothetical protein